MKTASSLLVALALCSSARVAHGFAPLVSTSTSRTTKTSSSSSSYTMRWLATPSPMNSNEKELRNTIASNNERVDQEEQYAVVDGENLYKGLGLEAVDAAAGASPSSTPLTQQQQQQQQVIALIDDQDSAKSNNKNSNSHAAIMNESLSLSALQTKMQRLTKPRAYPLFLAEKAAEFAEMTLSDILHATTSTNRHGSSSSQASSSFANGVSSSSSSSLSKTKERIVILGSGWGAASFLKAIDTDVYDVTVISPRNHFVFTPMLAGASVGTVEYRSICEPIREINPQAAYLEATAINVDSKQQVVSCQAVVCAGNSCDIEEFNVEYDRLIMTIGAQTNTFGIPGVREHCNFLKTIEDARRIRTAIVNCFERANLPGLLDTQRIRDLTFCVIGAGPTGVEFAAELRDFIEQDGPKYYPDLLKYVRIKVIEATATVLAPFEQSLQQEAIRQLQRPISIQDPEIRTLLPEQFQLTELLLEAAVKEVTSNTIHLKDGSSIPYGIAVWAAGNGPLALTLQVIEELGAEQAAEQASARGRLAIDPWMRVVGGDGKILAFGDCTCITQNQLPATAQVASQQGEYLAHVLNNKYDMSPSRQDGVFPPPMSDPTRTSVSFSDKIANFALNNSEFAKPFQFLNLGILAYTGGGSALAQVTPAPNAAPLTGTGALGNAVWKGVYLSKQVSWRNRLLVMNDWTKRQLFGRDITRL